MHFIVFEGTSEERQQSTVGLDLCGDRDLREISRGDVLWIISRAGGDRPVPALCGRLVAEQVVAHSSSAAGFVPGHADCGYQLRVDEGRSERCTPFACDMVNSWEIWRQPFRGVRRLTDEQGRSLEIEWGRSDRRARG